MAGKARNVVPYNKAAVAKVVSAQRARIEAAAAKGGAVKQAEWKIAGIHGFSIVVMPSGVATYFIRYQADKGVTRKHRRQAIGRYDLLELHEAREMADDRMKQVARGADPVAIERAEARAKEEKENALTLRQLFAERREKDTRRAQRTLDDYEDVLEKDVFPYSLKGEDGELRELGDLPASEITPDQIADVLEGIEARSKHAAHKARSALGSTYRWGMGRRKVRINPVAGLGFTFQSKPRNRVLSDDELGKIWRAIDTEEFGATEPMRILLKLALLTGQRNSEVAGARISELTLDSANPLWRIPGERMKRKDREQIVPLSPLAVKLFARAVELAKAARSQYVFPGSNQGRRADQNWRADHIGQESVSRAMARLREVAGVKDARVHDFRKCITTWLRETQNATPDVCDLILHHARPGVTGSHYDFATLEGPVRKALTAWSNHVKGVGALNVSKPSLVRA